MNFKEGIPIYLQLTQDIAHKIMSGQYQAGQRVESVRDLALTYGVNPNTVQKALTHAEQQGLVYASGTEGRFVTEDEALINKLRKETIELEVQAFLNQMRRLGISKTEIMAYLAQGENSDE